MSFRGNDGNQVKHASIGMERSCPPDYEAQAASLKKKLDSTVVLGVALKKFSENNSTYQFADISSFAEMIGGVIIVEREQQAAYDEIIKQIEATA